ncbi:hypothetical protein ALQ10_03404 [Pseudomonas savastanoi pv. glycinea]|nr:hypothetical protein ALQ66_03458 [Pseudomonas savastanoi pv. glycinea]RMQ21432.1 hypothetical protein ALQ10_03404 [Pseudomonas savastanoi pv. glycinea]RMQ62989.1 hypothetical protein ALQ01_02194 [Pseudomonas savastanoi pv. glycinea]RMR36673.1 hypothetical protein ALP88_01956 [Pseudomonas savastanoi pv. glycinea]RMU48435.1 hypothetical protein ALP27_01864 [Pseudomonas savastanoi pv. glycinea]
MPQNVDKAEQDSPLIRVIKFAYRRVGGSPLFFSSIATSKIFNQVSLSELHLDVQETLAVCSLYHGGGLLGLSGFKGNGSKVR